VRRLALLLATFAAASCAHQAAPPPTPLAEGCADIARKLEREAPLSEPDKKKLVASLAGQPFIWKLRVLSLSDQTNPQDMNPPVLMDMECADRPRDANDGIRYLLSVYFDAKYQPQLAKMAKGTVLEVNGHLSSYEGGNTFAARGDSFR
jgi:hypothetical protein